MSYVKTFSGVTCCARQCCRGASFSSQAEECVTDGKISTWNGLPGMGQRPNFTVSV